MKSHTFKVILTSIGIYSAALQSQTATDQSVQSFTNADLNLGPNGTPIAPSQANQAIPTPTATQPSTNPSTNQNTPFKYPALTQDQMQQLNDQLNAQIQNAEQRVQDLTNRVQDQTRMPMSIDKVELEAAILDLDVKKTLVAKFANSPSLKSPKVRQILFQILAKNYIQENDLATLQAITNEERPYTYP